jgi:hypothetical protein
LKQFRVEESEPPNEQLGEEVKGLILQMEIQKRVFLGCFYHDLANVGLLKWDRYITLINSMGEIDKEAVLDSSISLLKSHRQKMLFNLQEQ